MGLDSGPAMMTLFDPEPAERFPPAQAHSATSVLAAAAIAPHRATQRDRILAYLAMYPSTDQELAQRLGMDPSSVRPRRIELERDGLVTGFGSRRTASGRLAKVWGCTDVWYGHRGEGPEG